MADLDWAWPDKIDRPSVLSANLSFQDWPTIFPNAACTTALIDRIIHHSLIISISGESYRKTRSRTRQQSQTPPPHYQAPSGLMIPFPRFLVIANKLDKVVDECEPDGDPYHIKRWCRGELLRDDDAIDHIWRNHRRKARVLPGSHTKARKVVAAALSYIRKRRTKMRYASHYAANLAFGSGETENACWQMQQRVELPGQSWGTRGPRGMLAIRGLTLSDRWNAAWQPYAAKHREDVRVAA